MARVKKEESEKWRLDALAHFFKRWRETLTGSAEISANDLSIVLKTTPATAEKVIQEISGFVEQFHATESVVRIGDGRSYFSKQLATNRELKLELARLAADLVSTGGISVACSPGTTSWCVARQIAERGRYVNYVTNNAAFLDWSIEWPGTISFSGGKYVPAIHACIGEQATRAFQEAKPHTGIISVSGFGGVGKEGVGEIGDLYVQYADEVPVLKAIVESVTTKLLVVADIHKFLKHDMWSFTNLIDLVAHRREDKRRFEVHLVTNPISRLSKPEDRQTVATVLRAMSAKKDGVSAIHIQNEAEIFAGVSEPA